MRPAEELTGLPEHVRRLVAAAADLPLQHRHGRPSASARRSAVLILLGEGPAGPDVLLIEKSPHLRSHAGQPAFPGGGVDPGDDYPVGTALREAHEEAGVDPAGVRVLVTLPELFLPPSNRLVVPVVGWWDDPADVLVGDPHEVASVARVDPATGEGGLAGVAAQVRRLLDQQDVVPARAVAEEDQHRRTPGGGRRRGKPVPQRQRVGRPEQADEEVRQPLDRRAHSCTPRCSATRSCSSSTEATGPVSVCTRAPSASRK